MSTILNKSIQRRTQIILPEVESSRLARCLRVSQHQLTRLSTLLQETTLLHHRTVCRRSHGLFIAPCAFHTTQLGYQFLRTWNSSIRARSAATAFALPPDLIQQLLDFIVQEVYVGIRMSPPATMTGSETGAAGAESTISIVKDIFPYYVPSIPNGSNLTFVKLLSRPVHQHAPPPLESPPSTP